MCVVAMTFVFVQFKKVLVADINIGYEEIVNTQVRISNGCKKDKFTMLGMMLNLFAMYMFVGSCF